MDVKEITNAWNNKGDIVIGNDVWIGNVVMWRFAVLSGLPHFYGKISSYVIIYRGKDKNTTQGNLAELVGSPAAPLWCK